MYLSKFDNLKPKTQNVERYYEYLSIILNLFMGLYDIDIDDALDKDTFWKLLISNNRIGEVNGHIGNLKYNGGFGLNESGKMTPTGIICLNGTNYNGNTHIIQMFETDEPIMLFSRFANQLSEVDLSQKVLVKSTRCGQIIPVNTTTEKSRIEKAYQNIDEGKMQTYVKTFSIFDDNKTPLELFDPSRFSSMEYLSSYHTELCRRLFGLFGFSMQGKDKQAQVSEDELDDRELPSIILPLNIMNTIQRCFDNINNDNGTNWTIKPSKIFERQLKDVFEDKEEKQEMKEGFEYETERTE